MSERTELKTIDLADLLWGKVAAVDVTIPGELEVLISIQSWGMDTTISATSSLNMLIS